MKIRNYNFTLTKQSNFNNKEIIFLNFILVEISTKHLFGQTFWQVCPNQQCIKNFMNYSFTGWILWEKNQLNFTELLAVRLILFLLSHSLAYEESIRFLFEIISNRRRAHSILAPPPYLKPGIRSFLSFKSLENNQLIVKHALKKILQWHLAKKVILYILSSPIE